MLRRRMTTFHSLRSSVVHKYNIRYTPLAGPPVGTTIHFAKRTRALRSAPTDRPAFTFVLSYLSIRRLPFQSLRCCYIVQKQRCTLFACYARTKHAVSSQAKNSPQHQQQQAIKTKQDLLSCRKSKNKKNILCQRLVANKNYRQISSRHSAHLSHTMPLWRTDARCFFFLWWCIQFSMCRFVTWGLLPFWGCGALCMAPTFVDVYSCV